MRRAPSWIAVLTVVPVAAFVACAGEDAREPVQPLPAATYVGGAACADCHAEEAELWKASHHDLAMALPESGSVLGDFDDAAVVFDGVRTTFAQSDGAYVVTSDGAEGAATPYTVAYTFGAVPLQQLLLPLDRGRYQAFDVAWDSRPRAQGGQRWFDLDPGVARAPGDASHWSGREKNWNTMCAECHSTGVRKGYDPGTRSYSTTYEEVDVSCEACHGPGSNHATWAASEPDPRVDMAALVVDLSNRDERQWIVDASIGTASRVPESDSDIELDTCGRCHARRAPLTETFAFGQPLADSYRVSLLEEGLYHPDGQPREQAFVYGSFLQSGKAEAGVRCSDCHEPHSGRTILEGNGLCAQCHAVERFASPRHTLHASAGPGSQCVDCHMPESVYLGIDARREHAFRVPRPDLAGELGTPDVCTGCHVERTPAWAAARLEERFGVPDGGATWAPALHAGRRGVRGAGDDLARLASDWQAPGIVRATALSMLDRYPSPDALGAVRRALNADDPLVRQGALRALEGADDRTKLLLVYPVLRDRVRGVRLAAARVLSTIDLTTVDETEQATILAGVDELVAALRVSGDRPEFQMTLGVTLARTGRLDEAATAYRAAIALDPGSVPARVNLADLYRAQGRDAEGEALLRQAIALAPDTAAVHHALGLVLIRRGQLDEAMPYLEEASTMSPGEPRFALAFSLALRTRGDLGGATEVLRRANRRNPTSLEILAALVDISRQAGDLEAALQYAERIVELIPRDPAARRTVQELRAALAR